ncbi:hypothetical protein PR048_006162 [Dryococelus australis]|uniref:Uncharacterized protein n=1 Tax=Dryococelus australis TaxID=614101 RepID=A0ABQ9IA83_9NEOP|nr:hypothetical protein PR048_006162 [Dryococelus australis]
MSGAERARRFLERRKVDATRSVIVTSTSTRIDIASEDDADTSAEDVSEWTDINIRRIDAVQDHWRIAADTVCSRPSLQGALGQLLRLEGDSYSKYPDRCVPDNLRDEQPSDLRELEEYAREDHEGLNSRVQTSANVTLGSLRFTTLRNMTAWHTDARKEDLVCIKKIQQELHDANTRRSSLLLQIVTPLSKNNATKRRLTRPNRSLDRYTLLVESTASQFRPLRIGARRHLMRMDLSSLETIGGVELSDMG